MDRADRPGQARRAGREDRARPRASCARSPWWTTTPRRSPTTRCARPWSPTTPFPTPPWWGVREVPVDLDDVYPYLDRHVLFKLHWGGRGVKGEAWKQLLEGSDEEEGFVPRLERMWKEQDYLRPKALLGYFPCNADGNEVVIFDPEDHDKEIDRLVFPRQPKHDRICLCRLLPPHRLRRARRGGPPGRHGGPRGHDADRAAREGRRVLGAAVRARPRRADRGGQRRVAALGGAPRTSASTSTRAGATRGATPRVPTSPSTRRCSACWAPRTSGCRSRAATPWSPSSRPSRSWRTTRRRSTSA